MAFLMNAQCLPNTMQCLSSPAEHGSSASRIKFRREARAVSQMFICKLVYTCVCVIRIPGT